MASDVISLADGRRLRWHEFGDPDGAPVIYTAGSPMSGLAGSTYDKPARAAGLRWISPDKPGYGGSGYHQQRSLTSWSDALTALAGHLGLDRFALAGESGGGPFTLAAARQLAGRVIVVALIASGGPPSPAEQTAQDPGVGQKTRIQVILWLARHAPPLATVQWTVQGWAIRTPARRERALRRAMARTSQAAWPGLRVEYEAAADALRPGTGARALVQELALMHRPWGFSLGEISVPVHIWHGMLDRNAPIAGARRLADQLPDATLHISEESEHEVGQDRAEELTSMLATAIG
jgi:pimeloyl-ACP methyl ester carboxylesterase